MVLAPALRPGARFRGMTPEPTSPPERPVDSTFSVPAPRWSRHQHVMALGVVVAIVVIAAVVRADTSEEHRRLDHRLLGKHPGGLPPHHAERFANRIVVRLTHEQTGFTASGAHLIGRASPLPTRRAGSET